MGNEDTTFAPNATGLDRIDINSDEALRIWAERLDASTEQIREAVEAVGDRSSDVELHLKGSRSTTTDDRVEAANSDSQGAPDTGHKPPMRHDQTGEFDYGVEGGQTQDHGPDQTNGTTPSSVRR